MAIQCVLVARSVSLRNIPHMTATASPHHVTGQTLLELDGTSLTIDDALEVARGNRVVALPARAAQAVRASRTLKQELIDEEIPIYGVTTGFGDSAPPSQIFPGQDGQAPTENICAS